MVSLVLINLAPLLTLPLFVVLLLCAVCLCFASFVGMSLYLSSAYCYSFVENVMVVVVHLGIYFVVVWWVSPFLNFMCSRQYSKT